MRTFEEYLALVEEVGVVEQSVGSIVYASGLPNATPHERVLFETGEYGEISSLLDNMVEILVFSAGEVKVGIRVARTGEETMVPVGRELLGLTVNALLTPIDGDKDTKSPKQYRSVDRIAPGIAERRGIKKPLPTGVTLVDMLIPLGKGQRELVIGDRKTGKTSFMLQAAITQARAGGICIWAAIGKKRTEIKQMEEFIKSAGVSDKIVIITASPNEPNGMRFITPYAAITLAEYFRDEGVDTLVILDDLSYHAKVAREIALLSKRFPGRDSYPVDIFNLHAKMLERAGNFIHDKGEVSITVLVVAETSGGDLGGYIQTNLMSITDGHIYFDNDLFAKGRRPAINPFLSVTRVGRQAQSPLRRQMSQEFILFLSLYEKMQNFIHFGAEVTPEVKQVLAKGEKMQGLLDQKQHDSMPENLQAFLFGVLWLSEDTELSPAENKIHLAKLSERYEKEPALRKIIDDLVANSTSLLDFIKKLQGEMETLKIK